MKILSLWGPVLALMALIFFLSSQPRLPAPPGGLDDKQAHALVYGALGALAYRALAGGGWRGLTVTRGLWALVIAVAYGVTDELHQRLVPPRTAEAADLAADACGAALAVAVLWVCGIIRARRLAQQAHTSR